MKRLVMLAVLCAFVLSAAAASAADIKATAEFKAGAAWMKNWDFVDGNSEDSNTRTFNIQQRLEVSFDFIASENLKAVAIIRAGDSSWGSDLPAAGSDTLAVRQAYLDFNWPGTAVNVKVGHTAVAFPNAVGGSMIHDARNPALVVSAPVSESVALTAAYVRAANAGFDNYLDVYAVIASINAGDMSFAPFAAMGNYGENTGIDGAYWLGLSSTMAFGDISVGADLNYGNRSSDTDAAEASGWYLAASAEYAMDMMTPEAFFVYTSGEDDDASNGSERMPEIAKDWAIGSFFFGGNAFLNAGANDGDAPIGFWALGFNLNDIASFAEGLSHQFTFIYAQGTNDKMSAPGNYGQALTEKDTMYEVDFNTYYKVYDALTIGLELGYVNLDADKDYWAGNDGGSAYKISTGLKYKF